MRDLRLRFGLILALALMPVLVFSMWRAYAAYDEDRKSDEVTLLAVAEASTTQVVASIDTMKDVARQLDPNFKSKESCAKRLEDIVTDFSAVDKIHVFAADKSLICTGIPIDDANIVEVDGTGISPNTPYRTQIIWTQINGERSPALRITFAKYDNLTLNAYVVVGALLKNMPLIEDNLIFHEDVRIALINQVGEVLIDPDKAFFDLGQNWQKKAKQMPGGFWKYENSSTKRDHFFIIPTTEPEIQIAVSKNRAGLFSWQLLNPLTSGLIPLLAWVFAFCAIWISADRMILIHLRKLQRSALLFSRGDKDERVGAMRDAPQQIAKLGQVFDLLADKVTKREEALQDALNEKETLLREIHHRVKNNLQIIISLLNIQERKLKQPAAKHAIDEARNRINAIALVHKGLYEGDDLRRINMKDFLNQLVRHMSKAMGLDQSDIKVQLNIDEQDLDADTAIPVALFMIEALTNSNKHGSAPGDTFTVSLTHSQEETLFTVSDMGQPTEQEKGSIAGTGQKLMKGFARQLSGTYTAEHTVDGYKVSLRFPTRQ